MLKNEYLFPKIGVDTAENEPEVEVSSIKYTCTSYVEPSPGIRAGQAWIDPRSSQCGQDQQIPRLPAAETVEIRWAYRLAARNWPN